MVLIMGFKPIFNEYKMFAEVPHLLEKFDEKHDDDATDSVWQTIPYYFQKKNFLKWILNFSKIKIIDEFSYAISCSYFLSYGVWQFH